MHAPNIARLPWSLVHHGEKWRKTGGTNPAASLHQTSLSAAAEQKQIQAAQLQLLGWSSPFLEQRWPPAASQSKNNPDLLLCCHFFSASKMLSFLPGNELEWSLIKVQHCWGQLIKSRAHSAHLLLKSGQTHYSQHHRYPGCRLKITNPKAINQCILKLLLYRDLLPEAKQPNATHHIHSIRLAAALGVMTCNVCTPLFQEQTIPMQ